MGRQNLTRYKITAGKISMSPDRTAALALARLSAAQILHKLTLWLLTYLRLKLFLP